NRINTGLSFPPSPFPMPLPLRPLARLLAAAAILAFPTAPPARAQVTPPTLEVYPAPPGVALSPRYSVRIIQAGRAQTSPVYLTQNPGFTSAGQPTGTPSSSPLEQTTAWTSFSTKGPVTVQIASRVPFLSARI